MAEHAKKIRCPLCEGHGELSSEKLAEKLTTPELRKQFDARITEILQTVEVAGAGARVWDFEKEVHSWNPALPMWNRSPKE